MGNRSMVSGFLVVGLLWGALPSCRKGENAEERGYSALNARTRIVRSGPYELAFELMDMPTHEGMMRRMNLAMHHDAKAHYVIMLTIIDRKHDRLVRNAAVEFAFARGDSRSVGKRKSTAPANAAPARPAAQTARGMIMPGQKMFHYAADFPWSETGVYSVQATVRRPGAQTVRQEVEFEL